MIATVSCVFWCRKYTCLWILSVNHSEIPKIWDDLFSFTGHVLLHVQMLSKPVGQRCCCTVSSSRWMVAVYAAHQCILQHGSLPWLRILAAAAQGVVSKVSFGWSTNKSFYLLIRFVLALFCPITNCLSCIRSTMRCLSAVFWAFCVQDSLFACDGRFCFGTALVRMAENIRLCISNTAV